ncbi:D-alanine--D-alanine ligase [uncultured Jatrophihabitans sp.]|uniref:D-alanine--D-alanine ligase family protein n=1 Tax=uncultured Jatrophihabitans sp. TaxID=1610747 RepID=UPI0035CB157E
MTLRVLHLAGSAVSDFFCDLSRLYAADCLAATGDPDRYEFHVAYVTPDGRWRFPVDLGDAAIDAAAPMPVAEAVARIVDLDIDVMVPQMFCVPGMTSYRALFDVLGIPYVGNPADVMALTAHKGRARAVVAAHGVAVPAGQLVSRGEQPDVRLPCVVKPVDADNSVGVSLVRRPEQLGRALNRAFEHSDAVLVETYVEAGREVRCGIVESGDELVCLPLEEYRLDADQPIRQGADKLARRDDGQLQLMAKSAQVAWIVDATDPVVDAVQKAARRCHVALGCRDYSLTDFRINPDGRPWFLEAGLYNSFAETSVVPTMARAAGISTAGLFNELVERAAGRRR